MAQNTTDEARERAERLNPRMGKAPPKNTDTSCRRCARPGLSRRKGYLATLAEFIWQMSRHGGFPSAINALNAALEYLKPGAAMTEMTSTENKRAPCSTCPGEIL